MEHMDYFDKNMQSLQKSNEDLYKLINNYKSSESTIIPETVVSKDGSLITKVTVGDKSIYLNSQYRPAQEAVSFVEQYRKVIDYSVMIFLGFGNGIIARQLREVMDDHVRLIFFEPSVEIFLHTLHNFDVSDLLSDESVSIAVKEIGEEEQSIQNHLLRYITFENYRLAIYDTMPKYRQLFVEDYEWLKEEYSNRVYDFIVYLNTRQDFGKSMAVNSIRNMKHLMNCNYRDDFVEKFPLDIPAIVVAAGPSLEKNIHVLKQMKGRAFIVAVDTALRYLAEQGLKPDLAVTVDAKKPIRLFESDAVRDMQLVIDSGSNYEAVELLSKHKLIFSGGNYTYYQDVFRIADREFEFLKNGGSVATIVFSLLREWGFQRIILVGQDLALAADKVHAGNDDVDLEKLDSNKIAIEGYYGETVYTTWDYDAYRKWLEAKIAEEDCPEVINATEGGAKIEGAIQMPLSEVFSNYCNKEFDFEKAIDDVPKTFGEEHKVQLLELWEKSIDNLNILKNKFNQGIGLIEEEIRLIKKGKYSESKIINIHNKVDKLVKECDDYVEIQFVDSIVAEDQERILDDIYEMNPENDAEHCRLLEKLKNYLVAMRDATTEVKDLFKELITDVT